MWSTVNFSGLALIFLIQTALPVFGFAPLGNRFRSSQGLLRSSLSDEPALRIGHGFDIHRLIEGTKLIIGR
jgi:hypothetical protein